MTNELNLQKSDHQKDQVYQDLLVLIFINLLGKVNSIESGWWPRNILQDAKKNCQVPKILLSGRQSWQTSNWTIYYFKLYDFSLVGGGQKGWWWPRIPFKEHVCQTPGNSTMAWKLLYILLAQVLSDLCPALFIWRKRDFELIFLNYKN